MSEVTLGNVIDLLSKFNSETGFDYVLCTSEEYHELEQWADRVAELEYDLRAMSADLGHEQDRYRAMQQDYIGQIKALEARVAELKKMLVLTQRALDLASARCDMLASDYIAEAREEAAAAERTR